MTTKITNSGRLGLLRVDLQTRAQHATDWSDPTPYAFIYPGRSVEVPVGPFSRAVVALRAIERGVEPTCDVGIASQSQLHVTTETQGAARDAWTRKSIEHNRSTASPYITLKDRVILESART